MTFLSPGAGGGSGTRRSAPAPVSPGGTSAGGLKPAGQTRSLAALPVLHLLVVDDDPTVRNACAEIARSMAFAVVTASDLESARAILKYQKVDLVLLDLKIPELGPEQGTAQGTAQGIEAGREPLRAEAGGSGLLLLEEVKARYPETAVIVMTASASVASAVEAMRVGAGDYLTKPFALEELVSILQRTGERRHFDLESRRLREKLRQQRGVGPLIGHSPEMEKLYRIVSKVAPSTHPVLILGEEGTGKELIARSIHFNGPNAHKPFVPVDCSSLVPELIEGELFGYAQSIGGRPAKTGLLSSPDGGTVYLDEVAELPLDLQAKLLRALQQKALQPLNGTALVPMTVRVLAATNRDLTAMVEQARFRKDLFFRLSVVTLRIPPLRARKEDIPELAQHFLDRVQRDTGFAHTLSDDALRVLLEFDWPGNVRELELAIDRSCALSSGPIVHLGDLPTPLQEFHQQTLLRQVARPETTTAASTEAKEPIISIAEMERNQITLTIRQLKGDKLMAAKLLGIGKTTLYRKLKEYGISI